MNKLALFRRKLRTLLWPPQHPEFVKAAHYFADGWALNSLQVMRPRQLREDMRMIAGDGFNSVILVVPWRGFQTDQKEPAYDKFHIRQLHRALSAAQRQGLSVILRVAYSHQVLFGPHPNGITLAQQLLTDETTQQAWLDHLRVLHDICSEYSCFRQGFFCWEELWHAFSKRQMLKKHGRRKWALEMGFVDYVEREGIERLQAIPLLKDFKYIHYHRFANLKIREFHAMASTVFPGLSMEFRVDKDPLHTPDGIEWINSDFFPDLEQGRYSYWAPFMGANNEGEELDAEEATVLFEHMLREVSEDGAHPNHVVDQFNFIDETPKFAGTHARIAQDQITPFLERSAPLLTRYSRGYGIWAYRDYRQNVLYNASFCMGLKGWEVLAGKLSVKRGGGATLGQQATIRQVLLPRVAGLPKTSYFDQLTLWVELEAPGDAKLSAGLNHGEMVALSPVDGCNAFSAAIPVSFDEVFSTGLTLELNNSGGAVRIRSMALYDFIYRSGIRNEDGSAGIHLSQVQALNRQLDELVQETEQPQERGQT